MSTREKLTQRVRAIKRAIHRRRLMVMLVTAIGLTLALTVISLTVYKVGGFYRYDLSRPGYEKERTEINNSPTDVTFDTTGPLTTKGIDTFVQQLDVYRRNLDAYNTFGNSALSDEDLQLVPGQTPAPQ